jgi:hypothetical protein
MKIKQEPFYTAITHLTARFARYPRAALTTLLIQLPCHSQVVLSFFGLAHFHVYAEPLALSLFDAMGREVRQIDSTAGTIDISDLPYGTYLLRFIFEDGSLGKKLIKK